MRVVPHSFDLSQFSPLEKVLGCNERSRAERRGLVHSPVDQVRARPAAPKSPPPFPIAVITGYPGPDVVRASLFPKYQGDAFDL